MDYIVTHIFLDIVEKVSWNCFSNVPDIVLSIHSEELGRESFLFSSFFIRITREPVLSFTGDETFLTGTVLSTFLMRRPAISELFLVMAAELGFDI